ncbi:hypothetical protein BBJ28_00005405 [Nothophytophthora sp. Chile5]|nr:hypothetical protein BBJ28_00005405 [Nothophytophthora sp. Chile5]
MAFFGFETSLGLRSLTSLNLSGLSIDETAISWIVKGCGGALQCLNLSRCKTLSDFALVLLAPLLSSPVFGKLNMQDCSLITDAGIKNLFSLEEEKRQDVNWVDDDGDEASGSHLVSLKLKNCAKIGDDAMVLVGKYGGSLTKLSLKGLRKVSDRGMMEIAKGCPSLSNLSLSGRHITAQTFKLLGKMCRKLHTLDISERQDLETPECFMHLCTKITDIATEALAVNCFQLQVLLLSNTRGITDITLMAFARTKTPLRVIDLAGNTSVTDAGVLALCTSCQLIQGLRLKGCDRLSQKTVKHCTDNLLPFTKPFVAASLIKTIATGGGNAAMMLEPLPNPHIELLRTLQERYESAVILQTRFRKWWQKRFSVEFLARRRLVRVSRAAKKIQACIREFLAWRRFLHLLSLGRNIDKILLVQAHVRGNRTRHQVRAWRFAANMAVRRIQRCYRPRYVARMRVLHFNAGQIQRVYRGFLGRQVYRQLLYGRKLAAAARIWRWYRKLLNHREFQARSRWLVKKIHCIQGQWRKYKRRTNFVKYMAFYRMHAVKIQSVWRRKLARWHVAAMRKAMNAATLTIQSVFRGHVARKRVAFYRTLTTNTATLIQTQWRRYRARKTFLRQRALIVHVQQTSRYARMVAKMQDVVRRAVAKQREDSALCIQRVYRGMLGRKRALLFRKIRRAKFARKGQDATQALLRRRLIRKGAVLCIQQWIRSVLARRKMLKVRRWRRFLAAQRIQRYLKEWLRTLRSSRKREMQIHAAGDIQRVFRGAQGRIYFKKERHRQRCLRAAQLTQRMYRGRLGRRLYERVYTEKMGATRMLQRAYRTRQARKFYEISKAVAALKTKEQYDHSLLGRLEARRNPMDELYRRAKLPREKEVLTKLKDKWEAHRVVEERAVRKLKRECATVWTNADEVIGNQFAVGRKLYGVTENVYVSLRELEGRKELRRTLEQELAEMKSSIQAFKHAMREAVESRRMLEGSEVFDLLKEQGLFMEEQSPSNQFD